jgi:hypothetical protein
VTARLPRENGGVKLSDNGLLRWTPLFEPKNAEIKLGFQALHD